MQTGLPLKDTLIRSGSSSMGAIPHCCEDAAPVRIGSEQCRLDQAVAGDGPSADETHRIRTLRREPSP